LILPESYRQYMHENLSGLTVVFLLSLQIPHSITPGMSPSIHESVYAVVSVYSNSPLHLFSLVYLLD